MSSRITEVAIPSDRGWKIVNDVPDRTLLEAALAFVVDGGHQEQLREQLRQDAKRTGVRMRTDAMRSDTVVINLRTKEECKTLPWMLAPLAQIHKMVVIDRDEIEGFRSIQQLIREYLHNKEEMKPLCIGVFGPPGSGKSFGIKQVVFSLQPDPKREPDFLEFNMAQFSRPEELASAFIQVGSKALSGTVPTVFFDEFDCTVGDEKLGWLRYFLAPMQDGKIFFQNKDQNIGKSIFVFAGGTAATYREFSREASAVTDHDRHQFGQAKGPDFISRLSGHINILGINRRDEKDQSFVLRRARIMRAYLETRRLTGKTMRTVVDSAFLKKMLLVGEYKHGARSITKVIDMCIGEGGVLHMPPANQLSMHIKESDVESLLSP